MDSTKPSMLRNVLRSFFGSSNSRSMLTTMRPRLAMPTGAPVFTMSSRLCPSGSFMFAEKQCCRFFDQLLQVEGTVGMRPVIENRTTKFIHLREPATTPNLRVGEQYS